jgi:hypothetical protein
MNLMDIGLVFSLCLRHYNVEAIRFIVPVTNLHVLLVGTDQNKPEKKMYFAT